MLATSCLLGSGQRATAALPVLFAKRKARRLAGLTLPLAVELYSPARLANVRSSTGQTDLSPFFSRRFIRSL